MADFEANYLAVYSGAGTLSVQAPGTITITDSETVPPEGDTFEAGDTLTVGSNTASYEGIITINGEVFIAYIVAGGSEIRVAGNVADPSTFNVTPTIDPADIDDTAPFTVCFAAGTIIATPDGNRLVEELAIGDLVTTADGRSVAVKWIGRQTVHKLFTPAERFVPVCVKAGALGGGVPNRDLRLTADHALIIEGLAINAGALVNGTTIAYDPVESLPDRVTYYHVETEDHDVILANGASAETYVDYVQRRVFDNYQEFLDLYGEERTIREMDLPRVSASRLVPSAIRTRLLGALVA